jgi:hypothetical protein
MRRFRGGVLSTFVFLLLGISGCALIAGVGDYEVVDDSSGGSSGSNVIDGGRDGEGSPRDGEAALDGPATNDANDVDGRLPPTPLCDVSDPSLVLCFGFEGNTNDGAGTPDNVAVVNVTFAGGAVGQGAHFDGTTSSMYAAAAPKLAALTLVTLEAFVTLEVAPDGGRQGLIDSNNRFGMFIVPGGFLCTNTQATPVQTTTPLTVGKPTHLACVRDGTTLVAYQDGVPVGSAAAPGNINPGNEFVAVGLNSPNGEVLHGVIDEVRVYGRPRSAAEIAAAAARARP